MNKIRGRRRKRREFRTHCSGCWSSFVAGRREKSPAAAKIDGERPLAVTTQNTFPNP